MLTVQLPVPEQPPPDQPAKVEPASAAAERETLVPEVNEAEQVAPQLMPVGEEVTVPVPVPLLAMLSVTCAGAVFTACVTTLEVAAL
jgi:hypothetical protein